VSAVFPKTSSPSFAEPERKATDVRFRPSGVHPGIDGFERFMLSLGLSVTIVPLIGLVLNFTWGIRLLPIMVSVSAFTLLASMVAAMRRWQLPEEERFRLPYGRWVTTIRASLAESESRRDAALNVLLVASVLLAVGSVAYAVTTPAQGESFSAIYLVTENESSELVANDYPTEFESGASKSVVLGVDNNEYEAANYSIVVVEQDVETANNETIIREQRELERFETRLGHDETWLHEHDLEPTITGEEVRIAWLLYVDGKVPDEPSTENADYHVHLLVSVDDASSDGEA
jgi:uncharacterized membrane protein